MEGRKALWWAVLALLQAVATRVLLTNEAYLELFTLTAPPPVIVWTRGDPVLYRDESPLDAVLAYSTRDGFIEAAVQASDDFGAWITATDSIGLQTQKHFTFRRVDRVHVSARTDGHRVHIAFTDHVDIDDGAFVVVVASGGSRDASISQGAVHVGADMRSATVEIDDIRGSLNLELVILPGKVRHASPPYLAIDAQRLPLGSISAPHWRLMPPRWPLSYATVFASRESDVRGLLLSVDGAALAFIRPLVQSVPGGTLLHYNVSLCARGGDKVLDLGAHVATVSDSVRFSCARSDPPALEWPAGMDDASVRALVRDFSRSLIPTRIADPLNTLLLDDHPSRAIARSYAEAALALLPPADVDSVSAVYLWTDPTRPPALRGMVDVALRDGVTVHVAIDDDTLSAPVARVRRPIRDPSIFVLMYGDASAERSAVTLSAAAHATRTGERHISVIDGVAGHLHEIAPDDILLMVPRHVDVSLEVMRRAVAFVEAGRYAFAPIPMRAERTGGTACDFDGGIGCPIDDAQWLLDYSDVIAVAASDYDDGLASSPSLLAVQARGLDVVRTVEPSLVVAMWPPVVAPAVRETNGAMMPRRAALREPEARVVTSLPSDGLHLPENAIDTDPFSYFASSRAGRAGDYFRIVFSKPLATPLRAVTLHSGHPARPRGAVRAAAVQVSVDGRVFREVGKVRPGQGGVATVRVGGGAGVVAVQFVIEAAVEVGHVEDEGVDMEETDVVIEDILMHF